MISAVLSSVFPVVRDEVFSLDLQYTGGETGVVKSDKQTAIFHTAATHILLSVKGGYELSLERIEVSKPEGS